MIWLTVAVKQSPIRWFGGLTRYLEELWRATNELRVGVLVMDRGGSDVTLERTRSYQDRSSMLWSHRTVPGICWLRALFVCVGGARWER